MSDTARSAPRNVSRFATHNVVATYPSPDEARSALTMLERKGVEGADIELFGPGVAAADTPLTNDELRKTDMDAAGGLGKRSAAVSAGVAVLGGALGALLGYLIAGDATGTLVGAMGGVIVGGLLGFLYGGYGNLPTNEQWEDTYAGTGETSLAVHSDDPAQVESALDALRGTKAKRLATCGPDGQLRDVA